MEKVCCIKLGQKFNVFLFKIHYLCLKERIKLFPFYCVFDKFFHQQITYVHLCICFSRKNMLLVLVNVFILPTQI